MDYFHNVLPPSQLLRLSASALNELLLKWRSKGVQHPRPISDFDISNDTGFLPSEPLQRLPPAFEFWERALAEASSSLTLGNDESEDGIAKREDGQRWRNRIREVRASFSLICRSETDLSMSLRARSFQCIPSSASGGFSKEHILF